MECLNKELEMKWCKDAILVQDACNLTGVMHGFASMLSDMRHSGLDEKSSREHPATYLFLDKIHDMLGRPSLTDFDSYSKAYGKCKERAGTA